MNIIAIDPGTEQSAILQWNGEQLGNPAIIPNKELLSALWAIPVGDSVVIEMIASYGMAVGKEVFETCVWIGRFYERASHQGKIPIRLIYRRDVKLHLCHSARAKDPNIRQALIDRFGTPGTKKAQGVTYGIKSHLWAAFALAVYAHDTLTPVPSDTTPTAVQAQAIVGVNSSAGV